jgi:hypothetical protein
MTVAKSKGWDTKALRRLLAERKRDAGNCKKSRKPCKCTVSCCYNAQFFRYTICGRFRATGIAGGDTMRRANTDVGRAGEFLAAYILETHGIEVHHVDRAGADLWCKVQGSITTVQVKASTIPIQSNDRSTLYYTYATRNPVADWYCFVALDRELLLMRPVSTIVATTTRIAPSEFNEANQRRTIEEMMNSC